MQAVVGKHYRHYGNGEEYEVIAIAHHSETLEEMVVYQGQYHSEEFGDKPVWVRPRGMFEEPVLHNGELVDRFQPLETAA